MTPSQARIQQAAEMASSRRQKREIEQDVRQWFKADFQIVYEAVAHVKLNQTKSDKAISQVLFQSILATHQIKLEDFEIEINREINKRLAKETNK